MTIALTEQQIQILQEIQDNLKNGFAYAFTCNVLKAGSMTEKQVPMFDRLRAQLDNYYAEQHRVQAELEEAETEELDDFDFSELDNFKFDLDEDNLF